MVGIYELFNLIKVVLSLVFFVWMFYKIFREDKTQTHVFFKSSFEARIEIITT